MSTHTVLIAVIAGGLGGFIGSLITSWIRARR
jgi:hypothetical protein